MCENVTHHCNFRTIVVSRTHLEANGTLNLSVPTGLPESDVEVVVVVQPLPRERRGWPQGFIDETYGAFAEQPIERGHQGSIEEREALI